MRTVGVEEELLLVDARRHRPAARGERVVAASEAGDGAAVEHEFKQEQVEIGSSPQTSLAELRADLVRLRADAQSAAETSGSSVVAIATSPWKISPKATPDDRYQRMVAEFGLLAREQLTCGQHVHISIDSRAEGVAVLDRIRGWLPVLLAISANSPYYQQQDTGYASFRSVLWGRWPSAGPCDLHGSEAGYDGLIESMIRSGSALDDAMIYFDARLSVRYPTVEIRVADVCTDVRDAVLLAGLARALVDTAATQWQQQIPPLPITTAVLRGAAWRAARFGLSGGLIDPMTGDVTSAFTLLDQLIELVGPALHANGDAEFVAEGLTRLRADGTGADRQRAAHTGEDFSSVMLDAERRTRSG